MELNLRGKYALVTAASQGLGRACAEALAEEGVRVAICSRNKKHIDETAREISVKTGTDVVGFTCDLTNAENVKQLVLAVQGYFSNIDILVLNHGNPPSGSFFNINIDQWDEGLNLCFWPSLELCRAFIPGMKKNRWGRIVFISSVFAKEPDPDYVVSSTLRSALLGLAKCLARELAIYGVTVNTVLSGFFDTPLLRSLAQKEAQRSDKSIDEILKAWTSTIPSGKIAKPEVLGKIVALLSSEIVSELTGTGIAIDGCISHGLI